LFGAFRPPCLTVGPAACACGRGCRAANLAAALGHAYTTVKSEGKLPADEIAAAAERAMDAAAARQAQPRRGRRGSGLLRRWWGG
jgi:hypothetical protein